MVSKQPIKGGHCYQCYVMVNGLWTVLYSITQSPTFLRISYIPCTFSICSVPGVQKTNVQLRRREHVVIVDAKYTLELMNNFARVNTST